MAEEKGCEPLQRFHALRDFESRLFDQLEYSSVTDSLYQLPEEKSIIFLRASHSHRGGSSADFAKAKSDTAYGGPPHLSAIGSSEPIL